MSPNTISQSQVGTSCTTDYLTVPALDTSANALDLRSTTSGVITVAPNFNRFCGRFFNEAAGATTDATFCTGIVPFRVGFVTDGTEAAAGTAGKK